MNLINAESAVETCCEGSNADAEQVPPVGLHSCRLDTMLASRRLAKVATSGVLRSGSAAFRGLADGKVYQREDVDDGNKIVIEMNGGDERSCTKTYLIADKYR